MNFHTETISTHCVYLVDLNYFNLEFLKYFCLKKYLTFKSALKMKAVTLQITVFFLDSTYDPSSNDTRIPQFYLIIPPFW